jgi:hypothetical protein
VLEQPKIRLFLDILGDILDDVKNSESLSDEERDGLCSDLEKLHGSYFVKKNALQCILPVGTEYYASGSDFEAVVSEISYSVDENEITLELAVKNFWHQSLQYLLDERNGWVLIA